MNKRKKKKLQQFYIEETGDQTGNGQDSGSSQDAGNSQDAGSSLNFVYLDPEEEAMKARQRARREGRAVSLMSYLTNKTDEERIRDARLAQEAVLVKAGSADKEADETGAAAGAAKGADADAGTGSAKGSGSGIGADAGTGTGNGSGAGAGTDTVSGLNAAGAWDSAGAWDADTAVQDAADSDESGWDDENSPADDSSALEQDPEPEYEDPFDRILYSVDLSAIPEEEWNDEEFWNNAEILKPQEEEYKIWKPWVLFLTSIICTALFCLMIRKSWKAAGELPWYWGMAGMALTLASFAGMVFGAFDFKKMARYKQLQGILGYVLYLIIFLLMAGLFVLGLDLF